MGLNHWVPDGKPLHYFMLTHIAILLLMTIGIISPMVIDLGEKKGHK